MRNILSQSAGSGNRDFHHRGLRVPGEILSENNDRTYLKADCPKSLIMTVIHGPVDTSYLEPGVTQVTPCLVSLSAVMVAETMFMMTESPLSKAAGCS